MRSKLRSVDKAGFVNIVEYHRPVFTLQVSLSPVSVKSSPLVSIVVASTEAREPSFVSTPWFSAPPLQGRSAQLTGLPCMNVGERLTPFRVECYCILSSRFNII